MTKPEGPPPDCPVSGCGKPMAWFENPGRWVCPDPYRHAELQARKGKTGGARPGAGRKKKGT